MYAPACLTIVTPVPPGESAITPWDQRDQSGEQAPSGTYLLWISHDAGGCSPTVTISEGIPALGGWALSTLVGCVCLAGLWRLRARRR